MHRQESQTTRRDFIKTSAAATVGASVLALAPSVHAEGSDTIKVGIIGCGGRGRGAGENVLHAANGVQIVALADYFENKVESCRQHLTNFANKDPKVKELGNHVDLPADRCFSGLDGYQKVINSGANYIILATPPGFRPTHLKAAVEAKKHIFTEKPVAVDGAGIRTCLGLFEQSKAEGLGIAAGTQRRHQLGYLETMKQIHDGAIGEVVAARCYWNGNAIWFRSRQPGMSDLDYQIHNWYHFAYLCGDHIVEQHVHNLDVVNWALGQHPTRALGMGGRVRPCKDPQTDGHIFNFFAVEYEYPNGVHVQSMCRQVDGTDGNFSGVSGVSEAIVGVKGSCQVDRYMINGKPALSRQEARKATDPYVQEHTDLIASIRSGRPINELKNVAESTMTAIMGRMSAYTGKVVTWEQALNSKFEYMPARLDAKGATIPPVAVPGQTRFA